MKNSIRKIMVGIAALVLLLQTGIAGAAEIKLLNALGFKEVMDDLGPKFERTSGHKLVIKFGTLGGIVKMVQGGESGDVVIVPRQGIESLVKDGKADKGSITNIASSSVVVVYRKGAPKPNISTPEVFKRTLLAAKAITYGNPADGGASGMHFAKMLDQLGIAKEMKAKTIYSKPGRGTGDVVASDEAELGVNQLQTMMPVAGIEVAGPLPGNLASTTVFTSALMTGSKNAAAAKALVNFLRTPEAAKVIKAKGMEPG